MAFSGGVEAVPRPLSLQSLNRLRCIRLLSIMKVKVKPRTTISPTGIAVATTSEMRSFIDSFGRRYTRINILESFK